MTEQISEGQQAILSQIVPIVAEKLGVDPAEVTMAASFTNDLGADSLDTVELMMDFEKEYHLSIPDNQQELIYTIGDVVRLIEKMQADPDWLPPVKLTQQPTASKVAGSKTTAKKPAATKKQSTPKDAGSKTTAKKPVATKPTKNVSADPLQTTVGEILEMPVEQALNLFNQIRTQMALRARAEKKK